MFKKSVECFRNECTLLKRKFETKIVQIDKMQAVKHSSNQAAKQRIKLVRCCFLLCVCVPFVLAYAWMLFHFGPGYDHPVHNFQPALMSFCYPCTISTLSINGISRRHQIAIAQICVCSPFSVRFIKLDGINKVANTRIFMRYTTKQMTHTHTHTI